MRNSIRAFLKAQSIDGTHVTAAVSGGKDSMALLHCLKSLEAELGFSLSAAHFNHQLRGQEARRDEDFVRRICRRWDIPLAVGRGDVAGYAAAHGQGIEEAARTLRYEFLFAQRGWIVTAHTAQDNLETVLMHLVRGTGLHGLTGIAPVSGRLLRPMLEVTPDMLRAYLQDHGVPYVEDSTNAQEDYLRNRIRRRVLPLLLEENPRLLEHTAALTRTLRQEDDFLTSRAREALADLTTDRGLDCGGLLKLPEAMRYRVMGLYLQPAGQLGRSHLESAMALCAAPSPSARLSLPGGFYLERRYDAAVLTRLPPCPPEETPIAPGQSADFGPWRVLCRRTVCPAKLPEGAVALIPEALPLTLRPRRPGDRMTLPGGTKKLSRLMIDEKIPASWRASLPVVCQGGQIVAVLPLKAAARYRAAAGSPCILLSAVRMEDKT